MATYKLIKGDYAELERLVSGLFDGVLADWPYGLKFMGRSWDHNVPSRKVFEGLRRVLRPGALTLSFSGTRTWHRLACNLEDAGFEPRDTIGVWAYGTGWPKPADVSKYISKTTGPNSPEAARFDGYHANLAPAWEPVLVFRNPLDGTLAHNALEHGLAGYNIDKCRTPVVSRKKISRTSEPYQSYTYGKQTRSKSQGTTNKGRWPKNLILCCDCEARNGPEQHDSSCPITNLQGLGLRKSGTAAVNTIRGSKQTNNVYGVNSDYVQHTHADTGTIDRYFPCVRYQPKVTAKERGGLTHPTLKPIELCTWLASLILPPKRANGEPRRLLVPCAGAGSEVIGALKAGFEEVVGVELDPDEDGWIEVADKRIAQYVPEANRIY